MAEQVRLPQQGNSVESCILLEWRKQVGDAVAIGEVVCEVETDKASFEVESTAAGVLLAHHADEGAEVAVMAPLCSVGRAGEAVVEPAAAPETPEPSTDAPPASTDAPSVASAPMASTSTPPVSSAPLASTAAPSTASAPAPLPPQPTVPERTAPLPPQPTEPVRAEGAGGVSPRARLRAQELGVAVHAIVGSGPANRVIERDVVTAADGSRPPESERRAAASGADAPSADAEPEQPQAQPGAARTELPVRGIRKVIAERMLDSLQRTAQFTLHAHADARALLSFRRRLKTHGESWGIERIGVNDLLMAVCAKTLPDYPALNAHFLDDRIVQFGGVDLGFAVDTARGLLVPTIRGAHLLSLRRLSAAARELATRVVAGKATNEDLAEATFTCSNLGAIGVAGFTPVLNPPQVAILGLGAIEPRAIADHYDEHGEARGVRHVPHIALSLTIDHRAVDGAPAARFLAELCRRIAAVDLVLAG